MREATFTTELRNALDKWGAWSYKIPDFPYRQALVTQFAPEKPCDIIALKKGTFYGIETKMARKWEAFGIKDLTRSQLRNLYLMHLQGGQALVALCVRIPQERIRYRFFKFIDLHTRQRWLAKELRELTWDQYEGGVIVLENSKTLKETQGVSIEPTPCKMSPHLA